MHVLKGKVSPAWSHLQQEAGTLGHEGESNQRADGRKSCDEDEDSPAVELELWAHAEPPACSNTSDCQLGESAPLIYTFKSWKPNIEAHSKYNKEETKIESVQIYMVSIWAFW